MTMDPIEKEGDFSEQSHLNTRELLVAGVYVK